MNLSKGDIKSQIIKIALPASIGMIFHTFYNITDTFYAGLISSEAIGSMAITFPVFFILLALAIGFSQGTTALISNYIGFGDQRRACEIYVQAILYTIIFSIIMGGVIFYSCEWIFIFFGAEGSFLNNSVAYMTVIAIGAPFMLLSLVVNSILNAIGDSKKNRNVMMFGFFLNIALNPILCFGFLFIPPLGIMGIAFSTVTVQLIATSYLFMHAVKTDIMQNYSSHMLILKFNYFKKFISQSIPSSISYLMIAFGFFVITKFVAGYGPSAAAAFGVALRIEELIILPTIGLNVALVSIIGQSYGAKEYKRIREVYITSLKIGFIMMFFGSIILIFLGEFLSSLFTNDEEVIRYSKNYLYFAAIWSFLFPVVHMSGSVFLGIKKPLYTAFYAFIRLGVLPGIVIYLITKYFEFEINGIWIGLLIINFTVSTIIFFHLKRILSRIENQIKT